MIQLGTNAQDQLLRPIVRMVRLFDICATCAQILTSEPHRVSFAKCE